MRACRSGMVCLGGTFAPPLKGGLSADPVIAGVAQYARVRDRYGSEEESSGQPQVRSEKCRPKVDAFEGRCERQ